MSDISMGPWLGVLMGGVFTLILGGVLFILAAIAGLLFVRGASLRSRVLRFTAGPLACLGCTAAFLLIAGLLERPTLFRLGEWYRAMPVVGLGIAVVTTVTSELTRRRRKQLRRR